jgi:Uma2 family endonuclease
MASVTADVQRQPLLPFGRPLTRADLHVLPDDGHRYELIDGTLVVSPAPRLPHQRVVGNLYVALRAVCPPDLEVVLAPFAVALADDTEVQPDLLVAPREQFTERELPGAPLLAVEVLSLSTRRVDRLLKRDRLQEAGVASYWLLDPDVPSMTVLELREGRYVQVAAGRDDEQVRVERPFPLAVVPSALLR